MCHLESCSVRSANIDTHRPRKSVAAGDDAICCDLGSLKIEVRLKRCIRQRLSSEGDGDIRRSW